MTFQEFLNKYTGKKVDYDGVYGAQCVDLFRQYNQDVMGFPHTGAVTGAKDIWHKYHQLPLEIRYYNKVDNSKDFKAGDVLIWGESKGNPYGHVAIYVATVGKDFLVFEQDGFKQDGAKFELRSAVGLLGALRGSK